MKKQKRNPHSYQMQSSFHDALHLQAEAEGRTICRTLEVAVRYYILFRMFSGQTIHRDALEAIFPEGLSIVAVEEKKRGK